jgi:hypothetical protein
VNSNWVPSTVVQMFELIFIGKTRNASHRHSTAC